MNEANLKFIVFSEKNFSHLQRMANVVEVAIEKIDEVKSRLGRFVPYFVVVNRRSYFFFSEHWALRCGYET